MHGSRQELDDVEQHIQPLEEKERGERTWHGNTHSRGMEHSMQAEEQSGSGGTSKDQLSSCGMAWMKRGGRNAIVQFRHEKMGLCGAERDQ